MRSPSDSATCINHSQRTRQLPTFTRQLMCNACVRYIPDVHASITCQMLHRCNAPALPLQQPMPTSNPCQLEVQAAQSAASFPSFNAQCRPNNDVLEESLRD
eukprot:1160062-Pelagomonas_calceolata.AAC.3